MPTGFAELFFLAAPGVAALFPMEVLISLVTTWHLTTNDNRVKDWVTILTAALPALATASYGIRVIGDFGGIERRSKRTRTGLAPVGRESGPRHSRLSRPHGSLSYPSPNPFRPNGIPMPSSGVWKMMKVALWPVRNCLMRLSSITTS